MVSLWAIDLVYACCYVPDVTPEILLYVTDLYIDDMAPHNNMLPWRTDRIKP